MSNDGRRTDYLDRINDQLEIKQFTDEIFKYKIPKKYKQNGNFI